MHPQRSKWERAEELFFAAVELSPANRRAWLAAQCGDDDELRKQVEGLLAADASATSKLDNVVGAAASSLTSEPESPTGRRIRPYMVVRDIGRGGMGTVYHAFALTVSCAPARSRHHQRWPALPRHGPRRWRAYCPLLP